MAAPQPRSSMTKQPAKSDELQSQQQQQHQQQQQYQQQQQQSTDNAQRFPHLMLHGRPGNTVIRNGKCYLLRRSEFDPRWPEPQFIDEKVVDRNRLESLNLQHLNPDVVVRNETKCICTRVIDLRHDWYAHLHDGTVVCSNCAQCNRCFTLCFTAGRKFNSIDGFVLCNTCMLSYGRYRQKKFRLKIQPLNRVLEKLNNAPNPEGNNNNDDETATLKCGNNISNHVNIETTSSESNESIETSSEYGSSSDSNNNNKNNNVIEEVSSENNSPSSSSRSSSSSSRSSSSNSCEASPGEHNANAKVKSRSSSKITANNNDDKFEVLKEARFRDEGRRPLRKIYYPNPRPANYGRPDYKFVPPPFLAVDRMEGSQACPECKQQALTNALVVPGYARVYHEKSFRCAGCRKPMHSGYQLPESQFQSCSCPQQPKVWCMAYSCRMARMSHHVEKTCKLAPVHPGGRPKRDVPGLAPRFDPAKANVDNKEKKKKKKKPQL